MQAHDRVPVSGDRKVARWVARVLAGMGVLMSGFVLVGFFSPAGQREHQHLPFVSAGAPFGTYAESTLLGLYVLMSGFALSFAGGVLAFLRERLAAGVLIAAGLVEGVLLAIWLPDRTAPPGAHLTHLITAVLPPLVIGMLLLIVSGHPLTERRA